MSPSHAFEAAWTLIKQDDLDDVPDENKYGNCYDTAYGHVCMNPDHNLVHAEVTPLLGPLAGRSYAHAFTTFTGEDGKKMVYDPSTGFTMQADVYYALGQIREPNVVEYPIEEAHKQAAQYMTTGPWGIAENWAHSDRREEE